jgi:Na+/proline symporter
METRHHKPKKNFAKQFLGKHKFHIRKIKEKKLFGNSIKFTIYGFILFFFGIILTNLQPHSNDHLTSPEESQ